MSGKYTPGPWTVGYNENETRSVSARGQVIAFPVIPDKNPYHVALDEAAANAELIAAAPELLGVARQTKAFLDAWSPHYRGTPICDLATAVESVIARVEGRK